ncbi:nuclear cap-binding protein subunit 2 [Nematocida sp. AWRm80]|nr:nuclear cap-binding protein subunit 2 [Nematocida sp. AWRm80]
MNSSNLEVLEYLKKDELKSTYIDRTYTGTEEDYRKDLLNSGTIYIGNLSNTTREEQLVLLFSQCSIVKRVIMGLDAKRYTPCGFAFVEYISVNAPITARRLFSRYVIDKHNIYIDLNTGFAENRQFGRGAYGRQVREDKRTMIKRRRME